MTIGELLVFYERNHVAFLKNRLGTSRRLHTYVGQLAAVDLAALTKMQVLEWVHAIGQAKGGHAANQALQQLHSMFVQADEWELFTGRNPAHRIKKFPKHSRERFVQSNEMAYLMRSLTEEMPQVELFFLCLLFTGCRVGELQAAQWKDFDLAAGLWRKPTTKTGISHTIPLAQIVIDRLQRLPRPTTWVFPSQRNNKNGFQAGKWCRTAIQHAWRRIRKRAGLPDVRVHDLRRTAASWLAISGENLPVISAVLNHRSLQSTEVYARLSVAPVRRALDQNAGRMLGLTPPPVAPVRLALDDQAERMLGPVLAPMNLQPQQTIVMAASCVEERGEWPG